VTLLATIWLLCGRRLKAELRVMTHGQHLNPCVMNIQIDKPMNILYCHEYLDV